MRKWERGMRKGKGMASEALLEFFKTDVSSRSAGAFGFRHTALGIAHGAWSTGQMAWRKGHGAEGIGHSVRGG